ncbi:MAG: rod shape-determining protein MreC [Vicinamibacteraceae bacterium]|nr:rod shape-determining protein MreC [Vicinamibacteraceae bacterium]
MTELVQRRTRLLVLVVLIGHLTLISAQVTTRTGVSVLQAVTFGAFSEVQRLVASTVGRVGDVFRDWGALRTAREENERLERELANLQLRLQEQRALATEARRLQDLLDLRANVVERTLAAEVIAGNASPYFRTVTIDRGRLDGVAADMAVLAPTGVVGRVVGQPAPRASRVQLLIDRNAAAGAVTERTRAGGVVVGDGEQGLRMDFVSNLADVKVGDLVVTSGLDGIYPKGFVIGTVSRVDRGQGLFQEIQVTPRVDFSALDEVLVSLEPPRTGAADEQASTPPSGGTP